MIIPDINLLLYAHDPDSAFHVRAQAWWENLRIGAESVGVPWIVAVGFVRILSSPAVAGQPVTADKAIQTVDRWFSHEHINALNPGPQHLALFQQAMQDAGSGRNIANDAHIAALAIENDAEVHSNDTDFDRFPGLRWRNPLRV